MGLKPVLTNTSDNGIVRYMRESPPAHFTFGIEPFSLMSKTGVEEYESNEFESGGYKWKLTIYPNGDKNSDGDGHISLFLSVSDTHTLGSGWEVFVNCKLFAHDQIRDKYMSVHDNYGGIRRFHSMKNKWGFAQFISLNTFNQASNGFLVNDSCLFGAEVFVIKSSHKWERLLMFKERVTTWKISNFSSLTNIHHYSEVIRAGNYDWKMRINFTGDEESKDTHLALYLMLVDAALLPPNQKLDVKFKLSIKNQLTEQHQEGTTDYRYRASDMSAFGYQKFIRLSRLRNVSNGFITNDTLIVEVEFLAISEVSDSP